MLCWYQWMLRNGFLTSWTGMLEALESRFAPAYYEDPFGTLFKLQQQGSVNDYLIEFEHLAKKIVGLAPSFLLSCFLSGLTPDWRREVQALQPSSLTQAASLAKLQETKLLGHHCSSYPPPPPCYQASPNPISPLPKPNTTLAPKIPFKHLTSEEMALWRDQGLCYHWDDKWIPGHHCKPRLHILIADEDIEPFASSSDTLSLHSDHLDPQISLYPMDDTATPDTSRLYDLLHQHCLVILVDKGSTHNFIQFHVAQFLHLPTSPSDTLCVMVGDGNTLDNTTTSRQVPLHIQGHTFVTDLFHFPISGTDIVLGV